MGDRGREISGVLNDVCAFKEASGAFQKTYFNYFSPGSGGRLNTYDVSFLGSRVVPTGATFAPRSWGSLACCYLGQPAA